MTAQRFALTLLLGFVLLAPGAIPSQRVQVHASPTSPVPTCSMLFIENAGQWPEAARFQIWGSPLGAGTTWLSEDAIWITFVEEREGEPKRLADRDLWSAEYDHHTAPSRSRGANLKLTFPGSNPDVRIEPFDPLTTTVSYFIGNDPMQWRADVPVWGGVRYVDLYQGVDLVIGGTGNGWQLETALDASIKDIHVQIEGADLSEREGDFLIASQMHELLDSELLSALETYRIMRTLSLGKSLKLPVRIDWLLTGVEIPVDNPGDLIYGSFLGGSQYDDSWAIAVDGAGSAYVTGETSFGDFPTTPGAFDVSYNGGNRDAFVAKLNPEGSELAYASFLGGVDIDYGRAVTVDEEGNTFVTGTTFSSDFPTGPVAFDTTHNGYRDVFVVKLSQTGTALSYATYVGGNDWDEGLDIVVDDTGSAHVTGYTYSGDFPATLGSFDPSQNGNSDAFVVKINPSGNELVYATFIGGSVRDQGNSISIDETGSIFVAGETISGDDFPITSGAFDTTFNFGDDAFVVKVTPDGSALAYATYLGGHHNDFCEAIAVDSTGSAFVTGLTESQDFPTTPGSFDVSYNGSGDAFIARLTPDGSALVYGTFLGGTEFDAGLAIKANNMGSAFVTGGTGSVGFPTTSSAFDTTPNGSDRDVFVSKLSAAGDSLTYSTVVGGVSSSMGRAIALDEAGNAYVTGFAYSNDFPTTPDAYDTSYNGDSDAFVIKLAMPCCDLNENGIIDVNDLIIVSGLWGEPSGLPYDRDGDGWVTIVDIQRIARWWGEQFL